MSSKLNINVNALLSKLKSESKSEIYKGLLELRKNVFNSEEGIKCILQHGILPLVAKNLDSTNENLLDVALSVIGNCCLNGQCRKEVLKLGILKLIVSIINDNTGRDSILGRACRALGNLAQDYFTAETLIEINAVPGILELLDPDGKSSLATRSMGVRVCRLLWSVSCKREEMLELKLVHKVSSLLSSSYETKEGKDLVKAVLKALITFTDHCSLPCAQQIHIGADDFKILLTLTAEKQFKDLALICICNLCHVTNCRPGLGNAGSIDLIINELSTVSDSKGSLLSALCLFSRESVNRAKIRRLGGLSVFLSALRDDSKNHMEQQVLEALAQFVYDETAIMELLKEGLIKVLMEKLSKVVKEEGKEHKRLPTPQTPNKRQNYGSSTEDVSENIERCKRFRVSSPSYQAVIQERDYVSKSSSTDWWILDGVDSWTTGSWSPGSSRSMYFSPGASPNSYTCPYNSMSSPSWSGSSSPPLTPSDYPEVYSPVCHDYVEDDINCDDVGEIMPCEMVHESDGSNLDNDEVSSLSSKRGQSNCCENLLLVLLSRVSHMEILVEDLASQNTLETLMNYITLIQEPQPRAARVLIRLVKNENYLMPLVLQRFVLTLHSLLCQPKHARCLQCSRLGTLGKKLQSHMSAMAESCFGIGELAHYLLRGDSDAQRLLAVTIPFIVRAERLLRKLLIGCKGLKVLLSLLRSDHDNGLKQHVPRSLSLLSASLGIDSPQYSRNAEVERSSKTSVVDELKTAGDMVTFHLDEGVNMHATRSTLCSSSPVFAAMLNGDFLESQQDIIQLKDVKASTLASLLRIVDLGYVPVSWPELCLSDSFELLSLLDKFLVPGVNEMVTLLLKQFLSAHTVSELYLQASSLTQQEHIERIRMGALQFILSGEMAIGTREKLFKQLLDSEFSTQFVDDITNILEGKLNSRKGTSGSVSINS